eukprot:TRINITY_DN17635_c0_g1_i1.p1 TRINITY_DN17635_c0_g1~~TRINITY_DN17635_c0_g1_i1.p1  ORF type:complete len:588 (+),score=152.69 TRINITY_DN17635_c0_g1_i1:64-1827(+)
MASLWAAAAALDAAPASVPVGAPPLTFVVAGRGWSPGRRAEAGAVKADGHAGRLPRLLLSVPGNSNVDWIPSAASSFDYGATGTWTAVAAALAFAAGIGRGRSRRGVSRHRHHRPAQVTRQAGAAARAQGASGEADAWRSVGPSWTPGAQNALEFGSEEEYLAYLRSQAELPDGFSVGVADLKFVPREAEAMGALPMNLTVIALDRPTDDYAMVFTSNAYPGAPVRVGRRRLEEGLPLQAIAVNNKVSNVLPSEERGGQAASERVCAAVARALSLPGGASSVLPCSTGVIGWRLPAAELEAAAPLAAAAMRGGSALPAAQGIMTTDRYPKLSSRNLPGGARLVGVVKGAGMIEPNMSTMLCFLFTDAKLPGGRKALQAALSDAVACSFNSCSIDGDESTSDTCALLSSARVPCDDVAAFGEALREVCCDLAAQMVHNGEGTEHVIRVAVSGAPDDAFARKLGRDIVNGPLLKTAVAGNDPNVGRLVAKVGQLLGRAGVDKELIDGCVCLIGGEVIFANGTFALDSEKEQRLAAHLRCAAVDGHEPYPSHRRVVDVEVRLGGQGLGRAVVLGSDLTKEYVAVNADYRS